MELLKKIRVDFYLLLLIFVAVFLCYQNYTPNTILSGWDTLHPEFNLKQYVSRISSVWQEQQGLGAPPSQAHAAELPRMLVVGLFSLIFPVDFVRYAYFFLMMIIGPVGIYFLLKHLLEDNQPGAFLGALFYLLNIGTVQHFIAPFEMFATKFGYLGFLYLFSVKFIENGKKKDLFIFAVLSIFSSAMAHTATLWYVYFSGLALFLITVSLVKKQSFKKPTILLLISLVVNLYWILPNLYYTVNYSKDVITSKIHRLSTDETYLYNKKYGTVRNFILLKNFLFDWRIINNQGRSEWLLKAWQDHLNNPVVYLTGFSFFILAVLGMIASIKKKKVFIASLIPIAFICSLFLLSNNIPLNGFIKEVFRSPFTKFSLYFIFCLSIFIGYAHSLIIRKIKYTQIYFYIVFLLIIFYAQPAFQGNFISSSMRVSIPKEYFSLFDWSKKQDEGRMLTLPIHNLFGWVYYRWGSDSQQIYQGAGFNWFGLKQPTLNREFDRWYQVNEQSYREFSYAIYSQNIDLVERLLEKYRVEYILLDENVFNPGSSIEQRKLFYLQIENMLYSSKKINLIQKFGQKIYIFKYLPNHLGRPVDLISGAKSILPIFRWNYIDQAYLDNGDYFSPLPSPETDSQTTSIIYPARNVLDEQERIDKNIVTIKKDLYEIDFDLKENVGSIVIPELDKIEKFYYADIFSQLKNNKIIITLKPLLPYIDNETIYDQTFEINPSVNQISINNQSLLIPDLINNDPVYLGNAIISNNQKNELSFDNKLQTQILLNKIPDLELFNEFLTIKGKFPQEQINIDLRKIAQTTNDCGFNKAKFIKKDIVNDNGEPVLYYQTQDGDACDTLFFPNLSQNQGYILAIETQNINGLPLKFCFEDDETKRCVLEDSASKNKQYKTDYFIIPPYYGSSHYNLILSNQAIGDEQSINRLRKIQIVPFQYRFFQAIHWLPNAVPESLTIKQENFFPESKKIAKYYYIVKFKQQYPAPSILILNQAFEKGWIAIQNGKILPHVLVNNWANGWLLRQGSGAQRANQKITIIFWPQYLEFFGLGLLVLVIICLLFKEKYGRKA